MSAERAFLRAVGGGCRNPIVAYATYASNRVVLDGRIADPSTGRINRGHIEGHRDYAEALGDCLAQQLLQDGAGAILRFDDNHSAQESQEGGCI